MMRPPRPPMVLIATGLILSCIPAEVGAAVLPFGPLKPLFEQASAEYGVPEELLLVLARMGSGFEDRGSAATIEGGYGLMALRDNEWGGDSLILASRLVGVDAEQLKIDPGLNIRGAAAVLDVYADEAGLDRAAGLEVWEAAIVRYAGLDAESSILFADEVYGRLAAGFEATNRHGETFRVHPTALVRMPMAVSMGQSAPPDYGPAIWDPAPTCNYHAVNTVKDSIVIHMAEGTAAGVRAWYKLCTSAASVHYVVSEVGTVWQMVRESHVAWHAGCYNNTSIGVVHEGFSASVSHPAALYQGSALLCRHLVNAWQIPVEHRKDGMPGILGHSDAAYICGLGTVDDPGRGWTWTYFLDGIAGTAAGPGIVAAVSQREHYGAGTFDLSVAGDPSMENRAGGPARLLVTFDAPIACTGEPGTSPVSLSSGQVEDLSVEGNRLSVQISQVPEGQRLRVSFPGIVGTDGLPIGDGLCFGVLSGDVTGDGVVDVRDLDAAREAMSAGPAAPDLRFDVNLNGRLNAFDITAIRARFGRVISSGCP